MNTKKDQEIYKKAVKLNPDKILNYRYVGIISTRNKNPDLAMHEIPDYVFGTNENIETKDMCDLKDILNEIVKINPIFSKIIADSERYHRDLHNISRITALNFNDYSVLTWGTLLKQGE